MIFFDLISHININGDNMKVLVIKKHVIVLVVLVISLMLGIGKITSSSQLVQTSSTPATNKRVIVDARSRNSRFRYFI